MRASAISRVDLLTLRLFVAVCEERSINRAAEREHIAASALSRRLSDLEASLEAQLFRRHSRGLEALPAALTLLHHARILMRDMAQMESELADHATGLRGSIRLHATIWAIVQYLPSDLNAFLSTHPRVSVEIEEALSAGTIKAVAERIADIGIVASSVLEEGVRVLPYRRDRLVVVMPKHHDLARRAGLHMADLLPYDMIGAKRGSALDQLMLGGEAALGEALKVRVRLSGFETVCRMAEAHLGIGLVPAACAARHCQTMSLAMVPLEESWAERQLNICVAEGPLPAPVRALVEHLLNQPS